ncbi:MAG: formyltetrahydrofolate deformylase [Candidatus Omnitrophica bacterium]|jgi:formyltetrahydrofolate deformylase|nr:formyltetrahydrofolate deformylase [Candidatus Omnitrophota bacterium]
MQTYILLFRCRDQKGIVASISDFIFKQDANIIKANQYTTDPEGGYFFLRIEFTCASSQTGVSSLTESFKAIGQEFAGQWKIYNKTQLLRMGILVSNPDHCLIDMLYLWKIGELRVQIPFVASNFQEHRAIVEQYNIPFYFIAANKDNRREDELLALALDKTDFLVLARYMLVLSPNFLEKYNKDIINIHHGFLPSFKGADPYREALNLGVKVIGATAHFVNEKLDEGPIISQAVENVTHDDNLASLLRKGRNLEKRALTDAILSYTDYRLIRHENKTIVF